MIYVSAGGVLSPIMGAELTGGVYLVPKTREVGVLGERGLAIGLAGGLGIAAGTVNSMRNFAGKALSLSGGLFWLSGSATKDAQNRSFTGGSAGVAPLGYKLGAYVAGTHTYPFALGHVPCVK